MEYLFLLVDLKERSVLVIGGNDIAARKINILKRTGAKIRVVANRLCAELQETIGINDDLIWIGNKFTSNMLDDIFLVIVADADKNLSDYVCRHAEANYKFINVVDDQKRCSLIFPAIIDRSPVMIAISSSGKAPALVRMLREKLESLLPNFLGPLANLIGNWRNQVKCRFSKTIIRRRFWEKLLNNNIFNSLVARGLLCQAEHFLKNILIDNDNYNNMLENSVGSVALVGAGPGDSGLFTLRGLQLIQEADIILYDYLVSSEILDLARRDTKKICVGKRGGQRISVIKQSDINDLLIKLAKEGNKIVRLKGGDPFIFGRGGEELEKIVQSGIPCQVVPGVTAASISIYAGVPLTHRHYSHSVIFVTGSFFSNFQKNFDFRCFSYFYQTLVIYMGVANVSKIRMVLINNGCDVKIPVALISGGSSQKQKISIGRIENLEELVNEAYSPSLLIIGKVVNLHHQMHWSNQEDIKKYEFTSLINLF